jgi:secondary thiamine-phosphate synthase enzyme
MSFLATVHLETRRREEFLNLTARIQECLDRQEARTGALLVFCPHTTAGLTINEGADPDVKRDLLGALARLAPLQGDYRHAEGNSDAHIKASLMGSSVVVPVSEGRLLLGIWQAIYFCEFDGPRSRTLTLQFLGAD